MKVKAIAFLVVLMLAEGSLSHGITSLAGKTTRSGRASAGDTEKVDVSRDLLDASGNFFLNWLEFLFSDVCHRKSSDQYTTKRVLFVWLHKIFNPDDFTGACGARCSDLCDHQGCLADFQVSSDGTTCTCVRSAPSECGPNSFCKDTDGVLACACEDLYQGDPSEGCTLFNDCKPESNTCFANETCVVTTESMQQCLSTETIDLYSFALEEAIDEFPFEFFYDMYADLEIEPESNTSFPLYKLKETDYGQTLENGSTVYLVVGTFSFGSDEVSDGIAALDSQSSTFIVVADSETEDFFEAEDFDSIDWPYAAQNSTRRILGVGVSSPYLPSGLQEKFAMAHPCPPRVLNQAISCKQEDGLQPKFGPSCLTSADSEFDKFMTTSKREFETRGLEDYEKYSSQKETLLNFKDALLKNAIKTCPAGDALTRAVCVSKKIVDFNLLFRPRLALLNAELEKRTQSNNDELAEAERQACIQYKQDIAKCFECLALPSDPFNLLPFKGKVTYENEADCTMCAADMGLQFEHIDLGKPNATFTFPRIRWYAEYMNHVQGVGLLRTWNGKKRMVLTENRQKNYKGLRLAFASQGQWNFDNMIEKRIRNVASLGGHKHPGGMQAHGDVIAVAMEDRAYQKPNYAAVLFLRAQGDSVSHLHTFFLDGSQGEINQRHSSGAASVGFVKLADGRFLMAAAGKSNGEEGISFYVSAFTSMSSNSTWKFVSFFDGFAADPCRGQDSECVRQKVEVSVYNDYYFGAGGGVNLVTDCSGDIYMITMDGQCKKQICILDVNCYYCIGQWFQIFRLTLTGNGNYVKPELMSMQHIEQSAAPNRIKSFRWGAGVTVEDNALVIMNTERKNRVGSNRKVDGNVFKGVCPCSLNSQMCEEHLKSHFMFNPTLTTTSI